MDFFRDPPEPFRITLRHLQSQFQVVEKDLLIQEKEKLYVELRKILARQPGPEVSEQLGMYAKNLREKTHQMQAMTSELHMYQGQVKELKGEIKRLNAELDSVKHKFYEKKLKEQKEKQKIRELSQSPNSSLESLSHPKILGGGFNMASWGERMVMDASF